MNGWWSPRSVIHIPKHRTSEIHDNSHLTALWKSLGTLLLTVQGRLMVFFRLCDLLYYLSLNSCPFDRIQGHNHTVPCVWRRRLCIKNTRITRLQGGNSSDCSRPTPLPALTSLDKIVASKGTIIGDRLFGWSRVRWKGPWAFQGHKIDRTRQQRRCKAG